MTPNEAKKRMMETAVFAHDRARREFYEAFDALLAEIERLECERAQYPKPIG